MTDSLDCDNKNLNLFDVYGDKIDALAMRRTFSQTPKVSTTKIIGDIDEKSEKLLQNVIK